MNTPDSTTPKNVIDAAHRFRPSLSAQLDAIVGEVAWKHDYERWQASRDANCRRIAPELLELSREELLAVLTPAQRKIVARYPWMDVRNVAMWNLIHTGENGDPNDDGSGTAKIAA